MTTLTDEGRWTAEVLRVAEGVMRTHGIPRLDAIDVACRRVAQRRGVDDEPASVRRIARDDRPGRVRMLLTLGDAAAWVWVWVIAA